MPWDLEVVTAPDTVHDVSDGHWDFDFELTGQYMNSNSDMSDWDLDRMFVLPGLLFVGGRRVVSHFSEIPMRAFMARLPQPSVMATGDKSASSGGKALAKLQLVNEHPWLLHHIDQGRSVLRAPAARSSTGGPKASSTNNRGWSLAGANCVRECDGFLGGFPGIFV